MNVYLRELSQAYPNDIILLVMDGASWHRANSVQIPNNINILYIPPYTPEMNPIEQIWKEICNRSFENEIFQTLEKVFDRLCETICLITHDTIKSITNRE